MKIFISHQRKDNTIVNRIREIFKKYDIDYWVDIEEMYSEFGDFRAKIKKGMRECTHFLLIWSSSSEESKYVQEEAKQAISKGDNFNKFSIKIDETDFGKGTFKKFSDYFYLKGTLDNLEENLLDLIFEKISKNLLFDSQITIYKDKIKYDFEHFEKYSSADELLSVKSFKKFDTYNEFVSQRCKLSNNEIKENILTYVINLINDNLSNFIPIVGGYGSGKSLLMFYILYSLCKQPKNGITIPLFISLGKLNKLRNYLDFKERIYEYISNEYKINDKESYYKHLQSGNIIFLLDAFDEISTTIDSDVVNKNIENIKSLLPNKIVITSRNTYLTRNIEKNFIHDSNLIEILDFDNQNINDFVNIKLKHNKIKITKSELFKILDKPDIKKFTHKPLFLQIICDKHSEFQNRAITNPAVIFEILTNEWIIHDVNKNSNIDANKKEQIKKSRQRISESLAYYSNGLGFNQSLSNEAISLTEIKQQIGKEFDLELKSKIDSSELFQFYHDAQNSTFLIKEAREVNTDTFSFLHKSVIEYFVARRIVNYINENFNESNSEHILNYISTNKNSRNL